MPDHTEYETGARHPVEKTKRDANEDFSQDAAGNRPPKSGVGNSDAAARKPDGPHPRDVREDPARNPRKARNER